MCTVSNRHKKMFVTVLFSVTWHQPLGRKHWDKNLQEPMTLSFLFQGSMITQIMVDQINRWFHSGQGFSGSFDHPKGTHPTLRFMWQASCLLLGLCAMIKIWLVNLVNTWPRCFYFLFLTWLKKTKVFRKKKSTGILPTGVKPVSLRLLNLAVQIFTATVLAQLVEHVTAKQKVAGSIPGTGPILRVLKETEKWRYFLCTASR